MAYEDLYGTQPAEGAFSPLYPLFPFGVSSMLHTARMTHGFKGRRWTGAGQIGDYFTGMTPEVITMRKLGGQTMPSKIWQGYYNKRGEWVRGITERGRVGQSLGRIAPSLSHLGPSRYLTLWSALSGNQGAWDALNAMAEMEKTVGYLQWEGRTYGQAAWQFSHKRTPGGTWTRTPAFDYRAAMKQPWFETGPRGGGRGARWRDIAGLRGPSAASQGAMDILLEAQKVYKMGILPFEAEVVASEEAVARWGMKGPLGKYVAAPIARHTVIRQNPFMNSAGRMIGPLSRAGGSVLVGMEIYHAATWLGGLHAKATLGIMGMPGNIYRGVTSEIHRGTFMASGPMSPFVGATQRQRAMANIYDKQLNLRQVMGNEAAFLSARWGF